MRQILIEPISDAGLLRKVVAHAEGIYRLHEAGRDYTAGRGELAILVGKPVSRFDVDAAFGSIRPETFARHLLLVDPPTDLSEGEMLELLDRVGRADGSEFQVEFWVKCLTVNTGDARLSDLIFWPNEYFGDDDVHRAMSSAEMLSTALDAGGRHPKP